MHETFIAPCNCKIVNQLVDFFFILNYNIYNKGERIMILCSKECDPCCDFCIHAIHEEFFLGEKHVVGGPIGCLYHKDLEHQEIAEFCGSCEDFHCFLAKEEVK